MFGHKITSKLLDENQKFEKYSLNKQKTKKAPEKKKYVS